MLITHKNTATIGDFANTWPLLSQLSKQYGPLDLSLPEIYRKFVGLKEFLEYQQFINSVDFDDTDGDLDVQAHADWSILNSEPRRSYYTADQLKISIDRDLILKVQPEQISDNVINKTIIIDRTVNNILYNTGWFRSDDYYWLDFSQPISHNINICLQAKKVIATFTGLPIILDLFNKEFDLIWFDDIDGQRAYKEHYFSERNSKLYHYKTYADIYTTI